MRKCIKTKVAIFNILLLVSFFASSDTHIKPQSPVNTFVLKNGLRVVVANAPNQQDIGISVNYNVGTFDEAPSQSQYTHLIEHLMFTDTPQSPLGFIKPLQSVGVTQINAGTGPNMTTYSMLVPVLALEKALYFESARMANLGPALTKSEIAAEAKVVAIEAKERLIFNSMNGQETLDDAAIAKLDLLEQKLSQASLSEIKALLNRFYHPGNAVLAIVGDVDIEKTKQLVKKYFEGIAPIPQLPAPPKSIPQTYYPPENSDFIHLRTMGPGTSSSSFAGFDMFTQLLLKNGFEQLRASLVTAGLADMVLGGANATHSSTSFEVLIKPAKNVSENQIFSALYDLIVSIVDEPLATANKESVIATLTEQKRIIENLPLNTRAQYLASHYLTYGTPHFYAQRIEAIAQVSSTDVHYAAQQWFINRLFDVSKGKAVSIYTSKESLAALQAPVIDRHKLLTLNMPPVSFSEHSLDNGLAFSLAGLDELNQLDETLVSLHVNGASERLSKQGVEGITQLIGIAISEYCFTSQLGPQNNPTLSVKYTDTQTHFQLLTKNAYLNANISTLLACFEQAKLKASVMQLQQAKKKALDGNIDMLEINKVALNPSLFLMRQYYPQNHPLSPIMNPHINFDDNAVQPTLAQVQAFHQNWYVKENLALNVVSALTAEQLKPLLNVNIAHLPTSTNSHHVSPQAILPNLQKTGKVFLVNTPKQALSKIAGTVFISHEVMKKLGDVSASELALATDIIGGKGLGAKLNQGLRTNKGWTYGTHSSLTQVMEGYFWSISVDVLNKNAVDALAETMRILATLNSDNNISLLDVQAASAQQIRQMQQRISRNPLFIQLDNLNAKSQTNSFQETLSNEHTKLITMSSKRMQEISTLFNPSAFIWVVYGNEGSLLPRLEDLEFDVEVYEPAQLEHQN